jgi:hypothetical protein
MNVEIGTVAAQFLSGIICFKFWDGFFAVEDAGIEPRTVAILALTVAVKGWIPSTKL